LRNPRVAGEAGGDQQRGRAEHAERPRAFHACGDGQCEQRDDDAVQPEHQADEALAQAALRGEERRRRHDQPHAEREDEGDGGKAEEHAVAGYRERGAKD